MDATMLPSPADVYGTNFDPTFISFRDMDSLDAISGKVRFAPLNQVYKGGEFESHFTSEPGNTTYVGGPVSSSSYYSGGIKYGNAPSPIKVDFATNQVLEDGWGYVDDFTQWERPHIQGSELGDEFLNIDSRNFTGFAGNDWIYSFKEGGAWIGVGFGADFVDASEILIASPGALNVTNVNLTADDIWNTGYYAFNASDANNVGTGDLISLDGYRQIQDVIFGSAYGNIQIEIENAYSFSNDDDKGIALFVDDMLTVRHVESGQASDTRLKDIAEIHTTVLDDIIDLTSSYHADQTGNVKVYGLAGDDILWGGSSNETLDGGNGADLINGGAGDDTLTGGSGADIFEFTATSGNDTITDFTAEDILKFYRRSSDTNDAVIDEANDQVTWQGNGHVVTIDFDSDITATNVTIEYELI
jgi:Ca2+-binding RTX toxin-like protein